MLATDMLKLLVDHNLAAAVGASGDLSGALERYNDLLPVLASALGSEHRLTLRARRQRAVLLTRSGDTSTAFTEQVDLASSWSRLCGPSSPEHAEALGDIAETCVRAGLVEQADHYRKLQEEGQR